MQQVVGAETDLAPSQPNDAGIAGPEHFDPRTRPQPELLQPVEDVGLTEQPTDAAGLTGRQML